MTDELLRAWLAAREQRTPCVLVTVAASKGSVPREAGAKMLVLADGKLVGTIGGGKFEALVAEAALAALREKQPLLKVYPLHEADACSFGAICGGEVTVFFEPQSSGETLVLVGAGHCSRAIAQLARSCGFHVTVLDDRPDLLTDFPAHRVLAQPAPEFIASQKWTRGDALVLVSRNYEIDREALAAALETGGFGYLGMIGSERKVRRVFDDLRARGCTPEKLATVHAPIGLDIGADSPAEIAVSVLAEILQILRARPGGQLSISV